MHVLETTGMKPTDAQEYFDYLNGNLFWKKTNRKGKQAGCLHPSGYIQVCWKRKLWQAHRIIWLWHGNDLLTGLEIDHINRIKTDNRIENLRQVTKSVNNANRKSCYVNYCKGKWKAYTSRVEGKGRQIHLGTFNTKQQAEEAVKLFCSSQV